MLSISKYSEWWPVQTSFPLQLVTNSTINKKQKGRNCVVDTKPFIKYEDQCHTWSHLLSVQCPSLSDRQQRNLMLLVHSSKLSNIFKCYIRIKLTSIEQCIKGRKRVGAVNKHVGVQHIIIKPPCPSDRADAFPPPSFLKISGCITVTHDRICINSIIWHWLPQVWWCIFHLSQSYLQIVMNSANFYIADVVPWSGDLSRGNLIFCGKPMLGNLAEAAFYGCRRFPNCLILSKIYNF